MKRAVGEGVAGGGGGSVVEGGGGASVVVGGMSVVVTGGDVVVAGDVVGASVALLRSVPVAVAMRVPRGALGSAGEYFVYIESTPHVPLV